MSSFIPEIKHSSEKGTRVLVIDPDRTRAARHEAKTELDPYLQRVDTFFVSSISEARDLAKTRRASIAIFPERLEGQDFVTIQSELKNACPTISLVPLVSNPTLQQYRESKRIGGVLDFGDPSALETYEGIRDTIFQNVRELATKGSTPLSESLRHVSDIQRALILKSPSLAKVKHVSSEFCRTVASNYDLNPEETTLLLLSEKLYLPELKHEDYVNLLGEDTYGLSKSLSETGSWSGELRKPSSTSGMLITASNAVSNWISEGSTTEEIVRRILERPKYLMHVSLRGLTESVVSSACESISGSSEQQDFGT